MRNQLAVPLALVQVGVEQSNVLRRQLDVRGLVESADRLGVCHLVDLDVRGGGLGQPRQRPMGDGAGQADLAPGVEHRLANRALQAAVRVLYSGTQHALRGWGGGEMACVLTDSQCHVCAMHRRRTAVMTKGMTNNAI